MNRLILILPILLSACATSRMDSLQLSQVDRPYNRVLVLYYNEDAEIKNLDETTYTEIIQPSMNSLRERRYVDQLNRVMQRNLSSKGTVIVKSNEVFQVEEEVSYQDFQETILDSNLDAVLIVNNYHYWTTVNVIEGYSFDNQNAAFDTYLYDLERDKFVWRSNVVVNGGELAGYEIINGKLASRIARDLRKYQYIHPADVR